MSEYTPMSGWLGVDLDGTLAVYTGWQGPDHIGEPIEEMVRRVRGWLRGEHPSGCREVKIFTARAYLPEDGDVWEHERQMNLIRDWSELHIGKALPVTCTKDYGMIELWDDRVRQVVENVGRPVLDVDTATNSVTVSF